MYKRILEKRLRTLAETFPIVSVTGPRQSGKTTLCQMTFEGFDYVNLEDEESRAVIETDVKGFLRAHSNGLIIDEAHYMPKIFSALQVVCDEDDSRRYIISGSSNWLVMQHITQSLAGRVALIRLLPLSLGELGMADALDTDKLLYAGFYPAIWGKGRPAFAVYDGYFSTYIQRDVRQIMNIRDMDLFRKFVRLCATRIGNEFIASSIASEVGVSLKTVQGWLSILEASYVVFRLQPYHRNVGKRLTKTPKIYFCDTGLACYLLGYKSETDVANSPLRGALFENLVVAEMLKRRYNAGLDNNLYFYRDKSQHEVDLLMEEGNVLDACEIKSATAFHESFFRNLAYLESVYGDSVRTTRVIYDGRQETDRIVNFRHV